ncbi:MAG TPA: WD40 repeat domain-containing protein [Candidatus Babeliales bacterium]|nr:WD40 repeat domain-containing protein [Candidatus Babeliales bacterium]
MKKWMICMLTIFGQMYAAQEPQPSQLQQRSIQSSPWINDVKISSDGSWLAVAGAISQSEGMKCISGLKVYKLPELCRVDDDCYHDKCDEVTAVAFGNKDNKLIFADQDGRITLIKDGTRAEIPTTIKEPAHVTVMNYSSDDNKAVIGLKRPYSNIKVLDLIRKCEIAVLDGHNHHICDIQLNEDATQVVSLSYDNQNKTHCFKIWDIAAKRQLQTVLIESYTEIVMSLDRGGQGFSKYNPVEEVFHISTFDRVDDQRKISFESGKRMCKVIVDMYAKYILGIGRGEGDQFFNACFFNKQDGKMELCLPLAGISYSPKVTYNSEHKLVVLSADPRVHLLTFPSEETVEDMKKKQEMKKKTDDLLEEWTELATSFIH